MKMREIRLTLITATVAALLLQFQQQLPAVRGTALLACTPAPLPHRA
jgi:hypothetical protein